METTPARSQRLLRWTVYAGLWLLLSSTFGSQLYFAGYVQPWLRAAAAEGVYWLSWWVLAPLVFWWCRFLSGLSLARRIPGLLAGAAAALFIVAAIAHLIGQLQGALQLCFGPCDVPPPWFSPAWFAQIVRFAGVNLPVYAAFVLAWHAGAFYREARDRQIRAVQLESQLHQAQLAALRSQLNPHFLFNALHSIAELIHQDPRLAERLILRLGELLRLVLETSKRAELTLGEELEFIRGYLDIEQMRLGERLRVNWEIAPEVLPLRVPSLILQPLVENAIQHGVAAIATPGTLTLRARRDAAFLVIEIADTGPGVAKSVERPRGIGIANTRARLQGLYGERQSLELEQREGGTTVNLRLPAMA